MSPTQGPRIAACLILKNSEQTIRQCLASIRPFVDGVFVYDTGSTDGTLKILEKLNRQTYVLADENGRPVEKKTGVGPPPKDTPHYPLAPIVVQRGEWRDDFSWARTQSFAMPDESFNWILWLDDDDEILGAGNLRMLASTTDPRVDGLIFYYDYARDQDTGQTVCQLWRERLLRRDRGYEWKGVVHEVLVPPEGRVPNLQLVPQQVCHYRHDRPADRYDPARNLKLLKAEEERCTANETEPDPRTLAYLGTEHMAKGDWQEAAPYLERYLRHPHANWGDERMQVHHKLAACLRFLGHVKASIECEQAAVAERCDWAENYIGLAQGYGLLSKWDHVLLYARRALEIGMPQSLLILNPLEFTFVPLVLMADACAGLNRYDEALEWMRKAAALVPSDQVQTRVAELEAQGVEHALVGHVLALREALVRFDENEKAYHLLENVPYQVAENPNIVKARSDQREMVRHLTHPEEYRRWYSEEPKESSITDEVIPLLDDPPWSEYLTRARFLREGLEEQEAELGRKPRVLDLGCNDAWLAAYLWQHGFVMDGIELNTSAYEKALERKDRLSLPGMFFHGDLHDAADNTNGSRYDAVSIFEVLEHVPDVDMALKVCEKLLAPNGRVYLTTPNGAFERGRIDGWHEVERKGHLRAIPASELTMLLNRRGDVVDLRPHGPRGDDLTFAAYTPRRKKSRIVFYNGASMETWSPLSMHRGGIGGSETALVHVMARLAQAGHDVTVYAQSDPGLYAGALWRPFTAFDPREECDLLVVSRLPHVFDNPLGAKKTALWCHDHSYRDLTEERAEKMDTVVCLTDWQKERFETLYPYLQGKVTVIRNGIAVENGEGQPNFPNGGRGFHEREPRCVYSSSADRGLDVMLKFWPDIRSQVPDAELHVYYGWETFDRFALNAPHLAEFKAHVYQLASECGWEEGGVYFHGRVGQHELYSEFQQARVWTYPTYFMETSCITAMEARAAGLVPVTSDLAALKETVGKHGKLIPPKPTDQPDTYEITRSGYGDAFIDEVCEYLTNETYWTHWHEKARDGFERFDWSHRTREWEQLLPAKVKARRKVAA